MNKACFVVGTWVWTSDGPRAIEQLAAGGRVLAFDVVSGEKALQPILRTYIHTVSHLVDIRAGGQILTCSPEHPFWLMRHGWCAAGELDPGDLLRTAAGGTLAIESLERRRGSFTVHNIRVEGFSTYYVSPLGILVHNK